MHVWHPIRIRVHNRKVRCRLSPTTSNKCTNTLFICCLDGHYIKSNSHTRTHNSNIFIYACRWTAEELCERWIQLWILALRAARTAICVRGKGFSYSSPNFRGVQMDVNFVVMRLFIPEKLKLPHRASESLVYIAKTLNRCGWVDIQWFRTPPRDVFS